MSHRLLSGIALLAIWLTGCQQPLTQDSARTLAQRRLDSLLASESIHARTKLERESKVAQGWFFEYQVTTGSDSRGYTALVNSDGRVELAREGR